MSCIFFNCVVEKPVYAVVEKKRQKKGKIIKCLRIEINVQMHCLIYIKNTCKFIIMMKIFGKVKQKQSTNKIYFFSKLRY